MRRRRRRPSRPCAGRGLARGGLLRGSGLRRCRGVAGGGGGRLAGRRRLGRRRLGRRSSRRRRSWRPLGAACGGRLRGGGLGGGLRRGLGRGGRAAGGGGLLGRARRGGDTGGRRVHRHGDALVSESAQDDAAASGSHVSGAHGLGHLRAGHRAGRGTLADEGLQGLVSELRRECARLGGLVGHRRHRLPFVADGRTPRAREATVRKRRGGSCATPGRGAGWCSAGVVTRCARTL